MHASGDSVSSHDTSVPMVLLQPSEHPPPAGAPHSHSGGVTSVWLPPSDAVNIVRKPPPSAYAGVSDDGGFRTREFCPLYAEMRHAKLHKRQFGILAALGRIIDSLRTRQLLPCSICSTDLASPRAVLPAIVYVT